jgi:hypothetical protein
MCRGGYARNRERFRRCAVGRRVKDRKNHAAVLEISNSKSQIPKSQTVNERTGTWDWELAVGFGLHRLQLRGGAS